LKLEDIASYTEIEREEYLKDQILSQQYLVLKELRPHCLFSVTSTQDYLAKVIQSHHEGDFVVSRVQTRGKGRHGRSWDSEIGGLYVSIMFEPREIYLDKMILLLAESILKAFELFDLNGCETKPPNDVLCNGKKIAGVLVDASVEGHRTMACAGIGVNLNNGKDWDKELRAKATSYFHEKGKMISEDAYLLALLKRIDEGYSKLEQY